MSEFNSLHEVVEHYAGEIELIVDSNSAGDYTWKGVLGEFLSKAAPFVQRPY